MNPINLINNDDGTYTLEYFGRVLGYINRSVTASGRELFKAVSTHGHICYATTLNEAREELLEQS